MLYVDLKKLRADNSDMRQSVLAERLGCDQSYISQLETGNRRFTDEFLAKLESEFGDITPYITEPPVKPQIVQNNENGDNINGNKILFDAENEEIHRLKSLLESARNEIEWLRGMVEKLSLK